MNVRESNFTHCFRPRATAPDLPFANEVSLVPVFIFLGGDNNLAITTFSDNGDLVHGIIRVLWR